MLLMHSNLIIRRQGSLIEYTAFRSPDLFYIVKARRASRSDLFSTAGALVTGHPSEASEQGGRCFLAWAALYISSAAG